MTNETYTEDLGDIMQCSRERGLVANILNLWNTKGLPDSFGIDGAKFAFNRNSGYVFLVNDDYQCAMINSATGELEVFHSTPYNGAEGFLSDLLATAPDEYHSEDADYIRDMARVEDVELPAAWL